MPRKGVSAKRRLSNELDEQEPVQELAPELVAQNEQLRRTRSRMSLGSVREQTGNPIAGKPGK